MPQAVFSYAHDDDAAVCSRAITIWSDRDFMREEWCADAEMAGLYVARHGASSDALADGACAPDDVVCFDCPQVRGAALARLAQLDQDVAQAGGQLLVVTSLDSLEDVFACVDQSDARILVDPGRAERLLALGDLMARRPRHRVRELSEGDRLTLLRVTEQVGALAERVERLGRPGLDAGGGVFRFESPGRDFQHDDEGAGGLVRKAKPPLPDPRLVRKLIHARQSRVRFFDAALFADPAWDILLDLTAARAERKRVSVTSLCIASGVPPTTALRWIGQMVDTGLLVRVEDDIDRRRAFIELSDGAAEAMARYFAELGDDPASLG